MAHLVREIQLNFNNREKASYGAKAKLSDLPALKRGGYFVDLLRVTAYCNPGLCWIKEWSEVLFANPAQVFFGHWWDLLNDGPTSNREQHALDTTKNPKSGSYDERQYTHCDVSGESQFCWWYLTGWQWCRNFLQEHSFIDLLDFQFSAFVRFIKGVLQIARHTHSHWCCRPTVSKYAWIVCCVC